MYMNSVAPDRPSDIRALSFLYRENIERQTRNNSFVGGVWYGILT